MRGLDVIRLFCGVRKGGSCFSSTENGRARGKSEVFEAQPHRVEHQREKSGIRNSKQKKKPSVRKESGIGSRIESSKFTFALM
jgi:hypothetical protein